MKLRHIFVALLCTLALGLAAAAQTAGEWRNYIDSGNEVWFQLPGSVVISRDSDHELNSVTIHGFLEGARISVTEREVNGEPYDYVKKLDLRSDNGTKSQNMKSTTFYVRRLDEEMGSDLNVMLYAGSKKRFFSFSIAGVRGNPAMKRFLSTVRLGGARLYADPAVQDVAVNSEAIVFDKLPMSPEAKAALERKSSGAEASAKFQKIKQRLPYDMQALSREVIILRKPRPSYTDSARMNNIQGTIYANVQYLANGEIGNIIVDDRLERGLANEVVKAVRKIKFLPAEANGKPVDVTRTVSYTFSIY